MVLSKSEFLCKQTIRGLGHAYWAYSRTIKFGREDQDSGAAVILIIVTAGFLISYVVISRVDGSFTLYSMAFRVCETTTYSSCT